VAVTLALSAFGFAFLDPFGGARIAAAQQWAAAGHSHTDEEEGGEEGARRGGGPEGAKRGHGLPDIDNMQVRGGLVWLCLLTGGPVWIRVTGTPDLGVRGGA
jgi:hypothetical protein